MIESDLLVTLSDKNNYFKYVKYVKKHAVSEHTWKVVEGMDTYFNAYPEKDKIDWDEFSSWYKLVYHKSLSEDDAELYTQVFDKLAGHVSASTLSEDILHHFIELDYATEAADKLQKVLDGDSTAKLTDIESIIEEYKAAADIDLEEVSDVVSTDLSAILDRCIRSGGFKWRLDDLNVGIGPLHEGDLVVVAARPETGKTTFITSEVTYMVRNDEAKRPVLIFNNEEMGEKIMLRCYQSALNATTLDIQKNEDAAKEAYAAEVGGEDRIQLVDKADLSVGYCEKMIRTYKPCIVVFNVLDKVHGFNKIGSEVDRQRKLAQWARGLGKRFNTVVFAVAQADGSAEGEQWIFQNQIYGSKTGVPGEADVIITIGKTHDPATGNRRYIHVPKNKLPGDAHTDPSKRHGYFEVAFDGERGRFNSLLSSTS